ncbi:unnamed protein product [Caenorhabditis angaria]|uniref:Uncharacterized protein n=1 Tax=Caenorhabditis angaria TaxID=860376 RepID=A0A9P1IWT2_9PELO|nr:unnamed protein product [Caenorhabditis angaria]
MSMLMSTIAPYIAKSAENSCNCQYPIGLVVFLGFAILSLLLCICICCFDITKCSIFARKPEHNLRRLSVDPRYIDTTKFIVDRKLSLDPRLLEYSQLLNCSGGSSTSSRSVDNNTIYSTDTSLVTTV